MIEHRKIFKKYCTLRLCWVVLSWHASLLLVSSKCLSLHASQLYTRSHIHTCSTPAVSICRTAVFTDCRRSYMPRTRILSDTPYCGDKQTVERKFIFISKQAKWEGLSQTQSFVFILCHKESLSWTVQPWLVSETLSVAALQTIGRQKITALVSIWFDKVWFGSECKQQLCMTKACRYENTHIIHKHKKTTLFPFVFTVGNWSSSRSASRAHMKTFIQMLLLFLKTLNKQKIFIKSSKIPPKILG